MKRWARRLALALGALMALWLVAWLGMPSLLKWQLEKQATERLGRVVTVERVDFRPWTLELTLEGLRMADAKGTGEQVSIRRLYIDAEMQSLVRLAPVLDAITIEQPRLRLRHLGGGRYDVDDLLAQFSAPDDEPAGEPMRFALFNIDITGGAFVLTDDSVGREHQLNDLVLKVPFLSNLPSRREVVTTPQLAFVLNGSAFQTKADTTPFADHRDTQASISIPSLDLAPYLPYWPEKWPAKPEAGDLQVALKLAFEQREQPRVVLSGSVALSGFRLIQRRTGAEQPVAPLLAFDRLAVALNRLEPFSRRVDLGLVTLQAPTVAVSRDGEGSINWERVIDAWLAIQPTSPETVKPADEAKPLPPDEKWAIQVERVELSDGSASWRDDSVQPAAELTLKELRVAVQKLQWPLRDAAPFEASALLGTTSIAVQGSATDTAAQARVTVGGLPLAMAEPYLAAVLEPSLGGEVKGELVLRWEAAEGERPMELALSAPLVEVNDLMLGSGKVPLASLRRLQIEEAELDLIGRAVVLGKLALNRPQVRIERGTDGRWMYESWVKPQQPVAPGATGAPSAPWKLLVADVAVRGGAFGFADRLPEAPVDLAVTGFSLDLKDLKPLASVQSAMPVSLQLRVGSAQANQSDPGRLSVNGTVRLPAEASSGQDAGLSIRAQIQAERLPVHALEPYFGDRLNLELLRADTSFLGKVQLAVPANGLSLSLTGDAALEDFRANTLSPSEDLLAWKALNLRGIQLDLSPRKAAHLTVAETVLSDYFARIIVSETGGINLQGLVKSTTAPQANAAPSGPRVSATSATQGGRSPDSAAKVASAPPGPEPDIRMGPISLVNGRVFFSDRFIKPNYSANLSELTGGISAFSSAPASPDAAPQLADLSLRGRAEGTAALEIDGKLNPLARPLALDIKGKVRDLELPPLSPYSVKYAGYGIERGKLSVDVAYKIEPDGQLSASNQIILNQLNFGERVQGSDAPNLPVKLAVALLADRNGVIDINLPVSGSINDPEFRLGPLIFRLIFNLIGKAITAPFSLLASALGGGGDELSQVNFPPGRTQLDDEGRKRLDLVAKALADRPALQLTVIGHSDLEVERSAFQRARLDAQLLAEKRRDLARAGGSVTGTLVVTPEEYPTLLKAVFKRADIPKPRNLVGFAKDIPVPEMEALLLAAQPVGADAMRELAVARGVAVKDYLASRELPESRMFLGAPQLARQGEKWQPNAELKLAAR